MKTGDKVQVWSEGGIWKDAILGHERDGGKAGPGFDYYIDPLPKPIAEWGGYQPSTGGWIPARDAYIRERK